MPATLLEWMELLSYVVTVFGLPLAIYVFLVEQRKERQAEEESIHQRLSDEYNDFLKLVIDNSDLQLLSRAAAPAGLSEEQQERKQAMFGILVALFERAYILVYEDDMDRQRRRLWQSWETTCMTGASGVTSERHCLNFSKARIPISRATSSAWPVWGRNEAPSERAQDQRMRLEESSRTHVN